jgi:hypothetical protein
MTLLVSSRYFACTGAVRFRRNVSREMNHYSQSNMAYDIDIDARTARFALHAGRLQAGG